MSSKVTHTEASHTLTPVDQAFIRGLVAGSGVKTATATDYSLQGWQQVLPTLLGGALGATYGAVQAPGGSPLRGGLVGGAAGAGAGAAFTGTHQALASPYGSLMRESPAVSASLLLGAAGLGGLGGLRAGRKAADKLALTDKHKNNELDELNLLRKGGVLPRNLSSYFNR
jgi:hypothetical protein